jgi:hypothetical protein
MSKLLTIEADYLCRKCNQNKRIYHEGGCAFRSCGNEYCDRIEDIDAMIFKLLGDDYNSDNGDKTVQEQSKN